MCAKNDGSCSMRLQPGAPTPRSAVGEKQGRPAGIGSKTTHLDRIRRLRGVSRSLPCATLGRLFWLGGDEKKRARSRHFESSKSKGRSSPKFLAVPCRVMARRARSSAKEGVTRGAGAADRYIGCASWHTHGAIPRGGICTRISDVPLPAGIYFHALSRWRLQLGY